MVIRLRGVKEPMGEMAQGMKEIKAIKNMKRMNEASVGGVQD